MAGSARFRGDLFEAERLARRSVALHRQLQGDHHPETAWGLVELGLALSDQNKLDEAKECYVEALGIFRRYYRSSNKALLSVYSNLSIVLRAQGDAERLHEIASAVREAEASDSADWTWWQTRAQLHVNLGQAELEEARACFFEALTIFRKYYRDSETPVLAAYWNLGRTAWCQGDAAALLEMNAKISALALVEDPDCHSWALRGTMLANMGLWEESATCFQRAIELAPPHRAVELQRELAVALIGQGREQEADEAIRQAIAAKPDEEAVALNRMAWRLILTGETSLAGVRRAVELAERAVKLAPGEKGYWTTLGIAHYRAGAWQSAIDAFAKAVGMGDGGDAQNWLFLAMAHAQHGEKKVARAWYERAAEWLDQQPSYPPELRRYRRDAAELLEIAAPKSSADQATGGKQDK
jgi:tetratricopeptide (TPR) repeat protein